jgi:hypothetical protein
LGVGKALNICSGKTIMTNRRNRNKSRKPSDVKEIKNLEQRVLQKVTNVENQLKRKRLPQRKPLPRTARNAATKRPPTVKFDSAGMSKNQITQSKTYFEQFVKSNLLVDNGYILPRHIRTYVQPHKFDASKSLEELFGIGLTALPLNSVLIARPEPERFLAIGSSGDAFDTNYNWTDTNETRADFIWDSATLLKCCFDENIHLSNGNKLYAQVLPIPGYRYFKGDKIADGLKYYPGGIICTDVLASTRLEINYTIHNSDQATLTTHMDLAILTGDINNPTVTLATLVDSSTGNASALGHGNGTGTMIYASTAINALQGAGLIGYAFLIQVTDESVVGRMPSGFTLGLTFAGADGTVFQPTAWVAAAGIQYREISLWQFLADDGTLKNQYDKCKSYSWTGLHVLVQNVTPQYYKGGTLYAAQLPGGADKDLPVIFPRLQSYLQKQTSRKLMSNNLATGLSWQYVPEKIQDLFFVKQHQEFLTLQDSTERPCMVACITPPTGEGVPGCRLQITVSLMIEYITDEVDAMKMLSPSNKLSFLEHYLDELSSYNNLTENPDHVASAEKEAKRMVNSDSMRAIMQDLIRYGCEMIPVVVSSLL